LVHSSFTAAKLCLLQYSCAAMLRRGPKEIPLPTPSVTANV
jgi:hypothetical protein